MKNRVGEKHTTNEVCEYVESKLDDYLLDILKRFNNKVNEK